MTVGQSDGVPESPNASGPALKAFDLGGINVRLGLSSVDGLVPGYVPAEGEDQGDIVMVDIATASVEPAGVPDEKQRWIVSAGVLLNERYLVADIDTCDSPFEIIDGNEFCESGNPIGRELWAQQRDSGEWLRTSVPTDVMVQAPTLLAGGQLEFSGRNGSAMQVGQHTSLATLDLDAAFSSGKGEVVVHDQRYDARCFQKGIDESALEIVNGQPVAVVVVEPNSGDTERLSLPEGVKIVANGTAPPPAVLANWHCGVQDGYFIVNNGDGSHRLWNLRDRSKGPWEIADTTPEIAATQGRIAVLLRAQEDDPSKPYKLSVIDRDGVQHWVELGDLANAESSPTVFAVGGTIFLATVKGDLYVIK